jgi:hypothetical protein
MNSSTSVSSSAQSATSIREGADVLSASFFVDYLRATCVPLLGETPSKDIYSALSSAFDKDLGQGEYLTILEQFVSDPSIRVLQLHCFTSKDASKIECKLRVNLGIEYVAGKKQGHDIVCFIKRSSAPLFSEQPLSHQLQVMTLGLGKTKVDGDKGESPTQSEINTDEDDDDDENLLSVVYNYVHQSFGPLVNEYSKIHLPQNEPTNVNENTRGEYKQKNK